MRAPCGFAAAAPAPVLAGAGVVGSLASGELSPHGGAARPRPQLRWPSDPGGFSLGPRSLRAGPPLPPRSSWAWPGLWVRDRRAGRGNLADLGPVGSGRGGGGEAWPGKVPRRPPAPLSAQQSSAERGAPVGRPGPRSDEAGPGPAAGRPGVDTTPASRGASGRRGGQNRPALPVDGGPVTVGAGVQARPVLSSIHFLIGRMLTGVRCRDGLPAGQVAVTVH